MPETKINTSELKNAGGDLIKDLSQLLQEKTKGEVETTTDALTIRGEGKAASRTYIRVLLKKFLHQQDLKDYFRIIGGKENMLIIKEIKTAEEE